MNYTDKFNALIAELDELLEKHNDEIYTDNEYSLIYKTSEGLNCVGSGSATEQLAMLVSHMDSCRRTCSKAIGKENASVTEWGLIVGLMYASCFKGNEDKGEFKSTEIEFKF